MTKVKEFTRVVYKECTQELLEGIHNVLDNKARTLVAESHVPHVVEVDGTTPKYHSLALIDLKDEQPVIITDAIPSNQFAGLYEWKGTQLKKYMDTYHVPFAQAFVIMLLDHKWCGARLTEEDRQALKGPANVHYTPVLPATQRDLVFGDRKKEYHTAYLVDILREVGILKGQALSKMPSLLKVVSHNLGIIASNVCYSNFKAVVPALYDSKSSSSSVDLRSRELTLSSVKSDLVLKGGKYHFRKEESSLVCSMDDNESLIEQAVIFAKKCGGDGSMAYAHTALDDVFQHKIEEAWNLPQVGGLGYVGDQGCAITREVLDKDISEIVTKVVSVRSRNNNLISKIQLLENGSVLDAFLLAKVYSYLIAVKLLPIADSAINYYLSALSRAEGNSFNNRMLRGLLVNQVGKECEEVLEGMVGDWPALTALTTALSESSKATSIKVYKGHYSNKYSCVHRNTIVKLTGKKANFPWEEQDNAVPLLDAFAFVLPELGLSREMTSSLYKLHHIRSTNALRRGTGGNSSIYAVLDPSLGSCYTLRYLKEKEFNNGYTASYSEMSARKDAVNTRKTILTHRRTLRVRQETYSAFRESDLSLKAFKELAKAIMTVGQDNPVKGIKKLGKKVANRVGNKFLLDTVLYSPLSKGLFKSSAPSAIEKVMSIFTEGNLKWATKPENLLLLTGTLKENLSVDFKNRAFSQLFDELHQPSVLNSPWFTDTKIRAILEYLLVDCVNRQHVPDPFSEYADYLMAYNYLVQGGYRDWARFDEFPQSLRLQHDIITSEHTTLSNGISDEDFSKQYRDITMTSLHEVVHEIPLANNDQRLHHMRLIPPDNLEALKDEGQQLSHCVGGYGQSIKKGACVILFLRHEETPSKSLITVEFNKYRSGKGLTLYRLGQVQGMKNNVKIPEALKKALTDIVNELNSKCTAKYEGAGFLPFKNPKKKKKEVDNLQLAW